MTRVLPSTSYAEPVPQPLITGIMLSLVPSAQRGFGVELQRTSDVGGGVAASSAAASIASLDPIPPTGAPYLDQQPQDGNKRFYRARHIEDGWTAGAWTAWTTGHAPVQLSAKDVRLGTPSVSVYPVPREIPMNDGSYSLAANDTGGVQPSSGLYLPSTQKISVGTVAASSFVTKNQDVSYVQFSSRAGGAVTYNAGYLTFTSSGIQTIGAPFFSPSTGVVIPTSTALSALINFASSQELSNCQVVLVGYPSSAPDGGVQNLLGGLISAPASSAVGNWYEVTGGGSTSAITLGASSYAAYEVRYIITSTDPTNSKLARARVQYRMPSYEITR